MYSAKRIAVSQLGSHISLSISMPNRLGSGGGDPAEMNTRCSVVARSRGYGDMARASAHVPPLSSFSISTARLVSPIYQSYGPTLGSAFLTRHTPSSPFLHLWTLSTSASYSLSVVSRQTCLSLSTTSLGLLLLPSPWARYSPSHPSTKINPTRTITCASSLEAASVSTDVTFLCLSAMV